MKRFLIPFVVFFLLWILCGIAAAEEPITVTVNGSRLLFDTDPVIESDRTLVPLRVIFESLGATFRWEDAAQTAVAVKGDTEIRISVNNTEMLKNGEVVVLDVPARLIDNRRTKIFLLFLILTFLTKKCIFDLSPEDTGQRGDCI